jgi:tetratricopeptide (TPR) repeat protein
MSVTLADRLAALPPLASSDYHTCASALASSLTADDLVTMEELITGGDSPETGFHAFYVLLARHRRSLDADRFRLLHQRHAARFAHVPMCAVLDSDMALLDPAGPDLPTALRHAETAVRRLPGNAALVAHRARVLAEYAWNGGAVPPADLRTALHQVERAIDADPERPRFRAVLAQLAALLGEHERALRAVDRAMALEDSAQSGYGVRVIEYHRIRSDIVLRHEVGQVRAQAERSTAELEQALQERLRATAAEAEQRVTTEVSRLRAETLSSLGLLAAVIAFIVSTTQLADRQPVGEALRLLTGAAGMLALVFTAFGAAFGVGRALRLVPPALVGAALLLGALLL